VAAAPLLPELDRLGLARAFEQQLRGGVRMALSVPPHPHDEQAMAAASRAEELLRELAALAPLLELSTGPAPPLAGLEEDAPVVITLTGRSRGGVHLAGAPAGYELPILVNAIIDVSRGETGLSPATVKVLEDLRNPVAVQMLVSASCATCGPDARLALQMGIVSPHVDAWVLDAAQVPRLARRIGGKSLPSALINDICWVPGAQAELALLARVLFAGT
jgi:alkyl hydroperoxide reductase subunit AhpF